MEETKEPECRQTTHSDGGGVHPYIKTSGIPEHHSKKVQAGGGTICERGGDPRSPPRAGLSLLRRMGANRRGGEQQLEC